MQLNDPWQPWLGNMGQKRAPLGLNQGDMKKTLQNEKQKKRNRIVELTKCGMLLQKKPENK